MKKIDKKSAAKRVLSPIAREVWGIIFVFLGAYSLIALISYNHFDPSFFTQTKRLPLNYGGRIGANLAETLIQLAGVASFTFSLLLFSIANRLFKGARPAEFAAQIFWHVMSIVTAATFISLLIGPFTFGGAKISSGGLLGGWLAGKLLHNLNLLGACLFTLCLLLISLVFSTPISAANLFRQLTAYSLEFTKWSTKSFLRACQAIAWAAHKRRAEHLIKSQLKGQKATKPEIEIGNKPVPINDVKKEEEELSEQQLAEDEQPASRSTLEIGGGSLIEVVPPAQKKAPKKQTRSSNTVTARDGKFTLPGLELLSIVPEITTEYDKEKLKRNAELLKKNLEEFDVEGDVVAVRPGPVITMYEFKPGPGMKISRIESLSSDLALALSAESVRIAPIPGKSVVGIEIPNEKRETVYLREILGSDQFQATSNTIPLGLGKDISGNPVVSDIARMPHLLVAGASGKGKSVFINSLICSLLYRFTPNDLRLVMVDPKQVELNLYEGIPHLLLPVVDDPKKASTALKWATNEMERRYKLMAKSGMRNIAGFNSKLEKEGEENMRKLLCPQTADGMPEPGSLAHLFEIDEKGQPRIERMPTILVIIDEFADLMMTAPKDIEMSVARLGQKARAAGIHLVIATQRPSVDVITGLIKANLPSRVAFQASSKIDSRTILDSNGAEQLLGMGDMLFIPPGLARLTRVHGAFVNEEEIGRICDHWRKQGSPVYKEEILIEPEELTGEDGDGPGDELYQQAVTIARELGQISSSMLQRRLQIGYNRAARLVESMEAQGLVGPANGAKPREVIL